MSANFKSELRHNRLQSAPQINANKSQHSANRINLNHKTQEPSPHGLQLWSTGRILALVSGVLLQICSEGQIFSFAN